MTTPWDGWGPGRRLEISLVNGDTVAGCLDRQYDDWVVIYSRGSGEGTWVAKAAVVTIRDMDAALFRPTFLDEAGL